MKRFLAVSLLMLCLSFPTFGGHTQTGGEPCSCRTAGCIEDYQGECSNKALTSGDTPQDGSTGIPAELGIALVAILLWLRLKA